MRALALATVAAAAAAFGVPLSEPPIGGYGDIAPTIRQRRGKGQDNRRGKGLRAKPKKRSNRVTISKRVRRKHRRAA